MIPATQRHDQFVKLSLYQLAGVREYWIVDPENRTIHVILQADDGTFYIHEVYRQEDVVKVNVLEMIFKNIVPLY